MSSPFKFDANQRQCLLELKLFPEQIGRLEEVVPIFLGQAAIATMTEVRDKLSSFADSLRKAHGLINGPSWASFEAQGRLNLSAMSPLVETLSDTWVVDWSQPMDWSSEAVSTTWEDVPTRLKMLIDIAESAIGHLPTEQRRRKTGGLSLIWGIDNALRQGFRDRHKSKPAKPPPPYTITASFKKPFPEIATIVYEALGKKGVPERGIKAYMKFERKARRK